MHLSGQNSKQGHASLLQAWHLSILAPWIITTVRIGIGLYDPIRIGICLYNPIRIRIGLYNHIRIGIVIEIEIGILNSILLGKGLYSRVYK